MIRYTLRCDDGHCFESWFYDSSSFDEQTGRGLLACPICDSKSVTKAIMAPALLARGRGVVEESKSGDKPPSPSEDGSGRRQQLRALREAVLARTRDVGRDFAAEARRIHESESGDEKIRGQATAEEARGLLEDGILVLPIPAGPDDLN